MVNLSKSQWAYVAGAGAVVSALVTYWTTIIAYANSDGPPMAGIERVENLSKNLIQTVKDTTGNIRAEIIGERLFTYRRNQCDAITAKDNSLVITIGEQIRDMRSTYMKLTGLPYDLRPCDEY